MIIGVPKEIKPGECRVSLSNANTASLKDKGHKIIVETGAGLAAGITDGRYAEAGAEIAPDIKSVYNRAEMVLKVKEILPAEYELLREGQIIFTYIHSANRREQTEVLLRKKIIGIAYEDIMLDNKTFPLLTPMSEIAGEVGLLMGVMLMFSTNGGSGILPGGVAGVCPAKIVILGAGHAGMGAARRALGLGADVTVMDVNLDRLREIQAQYPAIKTLYSQPAAIAQILPETDLLLNAVKWRPGLTLVTRSMLGLMKKDALIMDVDCEPHGAIETAEYTSHAEPVKIIEGIRHCCIPNLPAAAAKTATQALSNATLPYVMEIAEKGWRQAIQTNSAIQRGTGFAKGYLTFQPTAKAHGLVYTPITSILSQTSD